MIANKKQPTLSKADLLLQDKISFFVPGVPTPQGSKTPWGTEANKNTRPWRESVKYAALLAYRKGILRGPVAVSLCFFFPRPKSHYTAKGQLKKTAPIFKQSKPDLDKLCRAFCDAITDAGNIWYDDSQVVSFAPSKKLYVDLKIPENMNPGLLVEILALSEK